MNILLAADGSRFTKKALAFLVVNDLLKEPGATLHVINVQPPFPSNVTRHLPRGTVDDYHREQAEKVLGPIKRFVDRHRLNYEVQWAVGLADEEICKAATRHKAHMIVMGTHGHGLLGRIVMGSVAQRVVAASTVPVLLVK